MYKFSSFLFFFAGLRGFCGDRNVDSKTWAGSWLGNWRRGVSCLCDVFSHLGMRNAFCPKSFLRESRPPKDKTGMEWRRRNGWQQVYFVFFSFLFWSGKTNFKRKWQTAATEMSTKQQNALLEPQLLLLLHKSLLRPRLPPWPLIIIPW